MLVGPLAPSLLDLQPGGDEPPTEEAIELCLETGALDAATRLIAAIAAEMVVAGRHVALARWLGRLSTPDRHISCQLFGRFEVSIDAKPVTSWQGNRGRLLLAYLLLHRSRPLGREALAAAFWPDASPEAARNRLHVTLHGLRRDLRNVIDDPVVVFARGYRLHPDLVVELDVDRFDDAVSQGRRCESTGDTTRAADHYEDAARLYRGDLLADAAYEEWTLLPREQCRVRFLHALDRLAHLRFEAGAYHESIEACQKLLLVDFCREDVHRMLMRAYTRLNQPHLALRQFETCSAQLRAELGAEPDDETRRVLDDIRFEAAV